MGLSLRHWTAGFPRPPPAPHTGSSSGDGSRRGARTCLPGGAPQCLPGTRFELALAPKRQVALKPKTCPALAPGALLQEIARVPGPTAPQPRARGPCALPREQDPPPRTPPSPAGRRPAASLVQCAGDLRPPPAVCDCAIPPTRLHPQPHSASVPLICQSVPGRSVSDSRGPCGPHIL